MKLNADFINGNVLIALIQTSALLILFYNCNNLKTSNGQEGVKKSETADSLRDIPRSIDGKVKPTALYQKLDVETAITVLTAVKQTDSASKYFGLLESSCKDWNLNADIIEQILKGSEEIGSLREWYTDYSVFPCYYTGELLIDGKRAAYSINAGAFSHIEFADSVMSLGYARKDYKRYFPSGRAAPSDLK